MKSHSNGRWLPSAQVKASDCGSPVSAAAPDGICVSSTDPTTHSSDNNKPIVRFMLHLHNDVKTLLTHYNRNCYREEVL